LKSKPLAGAVRRWNHTPWSRVDRLPPIYAWTMDGGQGGSDPMTVKAILSAKGGNVVTIEPTANVASAAKLLAERRIGALVVTGAGERVVGIVSERDVVQELAARGTAALDLPLTDIMTRKVTTCAQTDTISSIMSRMTDGKFRHVPVVEQGRLIGIVSIGDVVKHRLAQMECEQAAMRDYIQTA
jgi:CBS domain-containing protein